MLEKMTAAMFSEHLNTKFQLHLPSSETLELELIEVDDLGLTSRQERFSLIFRGPTEHLLAQATYKMAHDKLETFDLFIVPIARDEDGVRYEAAFNRLITQE
jgi:hypothetical protein